MALVCVSNCDVGTFPFVDDIGDEYHYLFTCERKLYLKPYFYVKPNISMYRELSTSTNEVTLTKLSKFVAIIMEQISVYIVFPND